MVVIKPNILITGKFYSDFFQISAESYNSRWFDSHIADFEQFLGTPGTGKSKLCAELSQRLSMKWQDVSEIAKRHEFTDGFDETLDCPIIDEEKVR